MIDKIDKVKDKIEDLLQGKTGADPKAAAPAVTPTAVPAAAPAGGETPQGKALAANPADTIQAPLVSPATTPADDADKDDVGGGGKRSFG